MNLRKLASFFLPVIFFLTSLFLRMYGIFINTPFWVDEFSTVKQANFILQYGLAVFNNSQIYFESHNITTNFLVAFFFKLFGQHEWAARLPFILIGSFVPVLTFYLAKKLFNTRTGICAALLSSFSYIMITWSRQARGYALQQLLVLSVFYLYFLLIENPKRKRFHFLIACLLLCCVIGVMTHVMFYLLIGSLMLHFIFLKHKTYLKYIQKPRAIFLILVVGIVTLIGAWKQGLIEFTVSRFIGANNLWYYHPLLWREYGLLTIFSLIGVIIGLIRKSREMGAFVLYIIVQLMFVCFIFKPYTIRYILPIFPLIFILTGYTITYLSDLFVEKNFTNFRLYKFYRLFPILLILFIIVNGHKFVTKPKVYYSINHDFREIANIDYDQVYGHIKKKGRLEEGKTAVIDTWWDRLYWYLGQNYEGSYGFRSINDAGFTNGLTRSIAIEMDIQGNKILKKTKSNNLIIIAELSDLKRAMQKYPRGFIFIDDSTYPHDVIEYAEKNLKKELYLDHFPLDDNPYSIWPATLYSWGVE